MRNLLLAIADPSNPGAYLSMSVKVGDNMQFDVQNANRTVLLVASHIQVQFTTTYKVNSNDVIGFCANATDYSTGSGVSATHATLVGIGFASTTLDVVYA